MALQKVPVNINFAQGLDLKTDPYQIPIGKFSRLENMVFTKIGRLTKRNGFGLLTALPEDTPNPAFITTYNGNLLAIGDSVTSLSAGPNKWVDKGAFYPISLNTAPIARSSIDVIQIDSAVSDTGLVCSAYTEKAGSTVTYKYSVTNSNTGEAVIPPTAIPTTGVVSGSPRVFVLGQFFLVVFNATVTATDHLKYIRISTVNPVVASSSTDISAQVTSSSSPAWDGVVANSSLFLAWNASDLGGAVRVTRIDSTLTQHSTKALAGEVGTMFSVTADITGNSAVIWVTYWDSISEDGYATALNTGLDEILAPTKVIDNIVVTALTSTAQNTALKVFYETSNVYSFASIRSDYISRVSLSQAGVVGTPGVVARSVGLASKAFIYNRDTYFLATYKSDFQPSYFLLKDTGNVVAKLAYSNGSGYLTAGLPSVTLVGTEASLAYLLKVNLQAVNKSQDAVQSAAGIYGQLGANLATFDFNTKSITAEAGGVLNLTGGFPWMYDGVKEVELGFFLYPDSITVSSSTTGGLLTAQEYFYLVTYEWTDGTGRIHRSAPSLPVSVTTTGSTSSNTLDIPTLRLTYKTLTPIRIVIYRWSVAQQSYYQITSISDPLLNTTSSDSVQYVDIKADSAILGNNLVYTTGGVLENIMAPACDTMTVWDTRIWLIDSEDKDSVWYSKPIVEGVPVEMTDLQSLYISPSISSQGPTGTLHCLAPMDDKLILFKSQAIYYINGRGPDATGNNSQYSEPTFIVGTLGCTNQQSIVMTPNGLMFQSDKGIWMLNRGLGYSYIGAPVEEYTNEGVVLAAVNIPETTQVRFTLNTGVTLMYDYLVDQWATFKNIPAISSTIYNGLHTYLDQYGRIFQETPGSYLDGSSPVLQGFTTGWINPAGLMGYQRIYWLNLVGTYKSPHLLNVSIGYDYSGSYSQSVTMAPTNYSGTWGSDAVWGSGNAWGGSTSTEQGQIQFQRQRCEAFQISVDEMYDPSFGMAAGEGLSLSGLSAVIGVKGQTYPLPVSNQFG